MGSPDPPEYKYVLRFPLSFIEAEKTNSEKIENRHFLSFFLSSSSPMRLTREPCIRRMWTEKVPKCFPLSCEVLRLSQIPGDEQKSINRPC